MATPAAAVWLQARSCRLINEKHWGKASVQRRINRAGPKWVEGLDKMVRGCKKKKWVRSLCSSRLYTPNLPLLCLSSFTTPPSLVPSLLFSPFSLLSHSPRPSTSPWSISGFTPTGLTKARALQKTRGLKAHKFRAVQHANVPSADKRAFNPAALLLSTPLLLSSLFLFHSTFFSHSFILFFFPRFAFMCVCLFIASILFLFLISCFCFYFCL